MAVNPATHELGLLELVTNPGRASYELGSPNQRHKFTEKLAHFAGWDERYRIDVPQGRVLAELRARGAPDTCWIVSESSKLDAQARDLDSAVAEVIGSGFGTVISCIPGVLVFFEGESVRDRYILHRPATRTGTPK